jgi:hypothetical protein
MVNFMMKSVTDPSVQSSFTFPTEEIQQLSLLPKERQQGKAVEIVRNFLRYFQDTQLSTTNQEPAIYILRKAIKYTQGEERVQIASLLTTLLRTQTHSPSSHSFKRYPPEIERVLHLYEQNPSDLEVFARIGHQQFSYLLQYAKKRNDENLLQHLRTRSFPFHNLHETFPHELFERSIAEAITKSTEGDMGPIIKKISQFFGGKIRFYSSYDCMGQHTIDRLVQHIAVSDIQVTESQLTNIMNFLNKRSTPCSKDSLLLIGAQSTTHKVQLSFSVLCLQFPSLKKDLLEVRKSFLALSPSARKSSQMTYRLPEKYSFFDQTDLTFLKSVLQNPYVFPFSVFSLLHCIDFFEEAGKDSSFLCQKMVNAKVTQNSDLHFTMYWTAIALYHHPQSPPISVSVREIINALPPNEKNFLTRSRGFFHSAACVSYEQSPHQYKEEVFSSSLLTTTPWGLLSFLASDSLDSRLFHVLKDSYLKNIELQIPSDTSLQLLIELQQKDPSIFAYIQSISVPQNLMEECKRQLTESNLQWLLEKVKDPEEEQKKLQQIKEFLQKTLPSRSSQPIGGTPLEEDGPEAANSSDHAETVPSSPLPPPAKRARTDTHTDSAEPATTKTYLAMDKSVPSPPLQGQQQDP